MVTLIGATTENPSFEINGALLSRTRVFVLQPLAAEDVDDAGAARARRRGARARAACELAVDDDAVELIAAEADGDARRALTVLEAARRARRRGRHDHPRSRARRCRSASRATTRRAKSTSTSSRAYHKSLRGSDPQGALYWMARMLDGGEDPMTLFRRAIAMAAEDIGLADPQALQLAVAARDAFHMLGPPEGYLPLAEMTIYLATAPKSNSAKVALDAAMEAAQDTPRGAGAAPHPQRADRRS